MMVIWDVRRDDEMSEIVGRAGCFGCKKRGRNCCRNTLDFLLFFLF